MAMLSTMYVALRVDYQLTVARPGENLGVETLGYTQDFDEGANKLEEFAARDVHGKSWIPEQHGDSCYDPMNDEGLPPPDGRFMVWDEDVEGNDPVLDRPSSVVLSVSIFGSKDESPERALVRSYKLCRINPMPKAFIEAETEGDKELARQIAESKSTM